MSGKKYSVYLGGSNTTSVIIPSDNDFSSNPDDLKSDREKIELAKQTVSPTTDDINRQNQSKMTDSEKIELEKQTVSPTTDDMNRQNQSKMTEVEIYPSKVEKTMTEISTSPPKVDSSSTESIPPEVEAVYKTFTDFLQSKDIKKFETLKRIPDLGINGLPITEKQAKLLYEYNPFLATPIIPNDVETRQEYDLDNDEFKNISVGDFLTKKYLNSVRNLDNNFFRTLLKNDIAGVDDCSYCPGNLNASYNSSEQNSVSSSDDKKQKLQILDEKKNIDTSSTQNTDATDSSFNFFKR